MQVTMIILIVIAAIVTFIVAMGGTDVRFHTKAKEHQIKVACVGDSITYGTVLPNVFYNCYPAQLGRLLGTKYHVSNFGVNGKTAMDVNKHSFRKTNQYPLSQKYHPNIVILMLGTNDTKKKNWVSEEQFKLDLKSLAESYLSLESNPRVILCTPSSAYDVKGNKYGMYHYGINEIGLQMADETIKELADEMQLELLDICQITSMHPEWYKFDGIHPDKNGAAAIANAVYCKIIQQ